MDIQVQEIKKLRAGLLQAKQEFTRQYEAYLAYIDARMKTCDFILETAATPLPMFDTSCLSNIGIPVPTQSVVPATPPPVADLEGDEDPEEEEDEEEEEAPPVVKATPQTTAAAVAASPKGLDIGRGGKPKLTEGMRYVLEAHGPLHPTDIAKKIVEHGLSPNSKNLVDYIRYTLSKNKSMFLKVTGRRGMWQAAKGSAPSPKAEASSNVEVLISMSADDVLGDEKLAEIQEVEGFRERERVGTVHLSPDQAKAVVDEMTDPRHLKTTDFSSASSPV